MSIYGLSPIGTELGPYGGPGLITVRNVLPESLNTFRIIFDREVRRFDDQALNSGTNASNYTLLAIDPTVVTGSGEAVVPSGGVLPTVQPAVVVAAANPTDLRELVLSTDANLEPCVRYQVTVSARIKSTDNDVFAGPQTWEFVGRKIPTSVTAEEEAQERFRDFDYRLAPDPDNPDQPTQVYRLDESSDIGLQNNAESLRKRVLRRVSTQRGGFAFLTEYGTSNTIKRLAKAGNMQGVANEMSEQIRREPDVLAAGVVVTTRPSVDGTLVIVDAQVTQVDSRENQFFFEFPL